jgi:hypothetical protein
MWFCSLTYLHLLLSCMLVAQVHFSQPQSTMFLPFPLLRNYHPNLFHPRERNGLPLFSFMQPNLDLLSAQVSPPSPSSIVLIYIKTSYRAQQVKAEWYCPGTCTPCCDGSGLHHIKLFHAVQPLSALWHYCYLADGLQLQICLEKPVRGNNTVEVFEAIKSLDAGNSTYRFRLLSTPTCFFLE